MPLVCSVPERRLGLQQKAAALGGPVASLPAQAAEAVPVSSHWCPRPRPTPTRYQQLVTLRLLRLLLLKKLVWQAMLMLMGNASVVIAELRLLECCTLGCLCLCLCLSVSVCVCLCGGVWRGGVRRAGREDLATAGKVAGREDLATAGRLQGFLATGRCRKRRQGRQACQKYGHGHR